MRKGRKNDRCCDRCISDSSTVATTTGAGLLTLDVAILEALLAEKGTLIDLDQLETASETAEASTTPALQAVHQHDFHDVSSKIRKNYYKNYSKGFYKEVDLLYNSPLGEDWNTYWKRSTSTTPTL